MKMRQIAVTLSLLCVAGIADAATATGTIAVSASVVPPMPLCSVSATPLNFGNYDPTALVATTTNSALSVNCTNTTPYNIGFSSANGGAAGKLTSTIGNPLTYALTSAAVGGTDLFATPIIGTGSGAAQAVTVFGSMPAAQVTGLAAGRTNQPYSDTITVTVTY